jgi:hypothetical protein
MSKWLDRLATIGAEKNGVTPLPTPLTKLPKPGSVSFGSAPVGGAEEISSPTDDPRLARLLRWGWPVAEAEALAARLARRDALAAAGDADDRVTCVDCSNYRPGRCARHRAAGLLSPEVGRDLAALAQRCAAHKPADLEPQTHKR